MFAIRIRETLSSSGIGVPSFSKEKTGKPELTNSANSASSLSDSTSIPDKELSASPGCNTEVTKGMLSKRVHDSHSVTMPCGVEQSCCPEAWHLVAEIADSVAEKRPLVDSKAFEGGLMMLLIIASFE